jgi:pimeloyl-ACP methyl ester carboxylesterase
MIYLRDIRKSFYVTGINSKINSIEKLISFIGTETDGYEVTIAGTSAGGYLAMLLGSQLPAKNVVSFGGQCNLWVCDDVVNRYYYIHKYKDNCSYNKFYDLSAMIRESNADLYTFCSAGNETDVCQNGMIGEASFIHRFLLDSGKHAEVLTADAMTAFLK